MAACPLLAGSGQETSSSFVVKVGEQGPGTASAQGTHCTPPLVPAVWPARVHHSLTLRTRRGLSRASGTSDVERHPVPVSDHVV
jgi:hypothetical protein